MNLRGRLLATEGILVFALALASPAHAQLQLCSTICFDNSCSLPCVNDANGQVVTCLQVNDGCLNACDSTTCTPQTLCSQPCSGNMALPTTCGASGHACCPGTELISRTPICKAQFYKAGTGVCVLIKRFDDVYHLCNGSNQEVNPDDFTHKTSTDAASCPTICDPLCQDLCR